MPKANMVFIRSAGLLARHLEFLNFSCPPVERVGGARPRGRSRKKQQNFESLALSLVERVAGARPRGGSTKKQQNFES